MGVRETFTGMQMGPCPAFSAGIDPISDFLLAFILLDNRFQALDRKLDQGVPGSLMVLGHLPKGRQRFPADHKCFLKTPVAPWFVFFNPRAIASRASVSPMRWSNSVPPI
jgi:hypothetical protein